MFYYDKLGPVPQAIVRVNDSAGTPVLDATTNESGEYVLGPLPLGDYQLLVSKEDDSYQAINVLDVSDILQHLVGYIALSQDQQRTADVSGNNRVGTTDASLLLRFLVELETSFPAGPFWQFQPAEPIFSLLEDKIQNFTSFLIGDVNGDWEAVTPVFKVVAASPPTLNFLELPFAPRGTAALVLSGESLVAVRGGILKLIYDPEAMEIEEVTSLGLMDNFLVAVNLDYPGEIKVAFAGADAVEGSGDLLYLNFKERGLHGTTTTIEVQSASLNGTQLSPRSLASRIHTLGGTLNDLNTAIEQSHTDLPASNQLGRNYPNPFNSSTAIQYQIVESGLVGLDIFDLGGQKVKVLADKFQVRWIIRNFLGWNG